LSILVLFQTNIAMDLTNWSWLPHWRSGCKTYTETKRASTKRTKTNWHLWTRKPKC